jgi:hypothetical protein
VVAICAGWQSGKTVLLPYWLLREMQRCGPGDYGAFSSTYKLLNRKFLPELKKCFNTLAQFRSVDQQFIFTAEGNRLIHGPAWSGEPTVVQLGYAENPDSLESATLKGVAWDECGQRLVPEQSFHTVKSRLMANRGRMCLASRPYESNWFERLVTQERSDTFVVSFASWDNPVNPAEDDPYWDQIRQEMPEWRVTMQYGGRYTMPAGLIYDCFDYEQNTCDDFDVSGLPVYPGMDFGKINTAGLAVADDPSSGILYVIGEYHAAAKRDYPEHVASMNALTRPRAGGKAYSPGCGGNKHGEDGWREAFRMHGLPLSEPPENNIDVQIQGVWSLISQRKLVFFRQGARETIQDLQHYSHKVDVDGNVLPVIEDDQKQHRLAALRYICVKLRPPISNQGAPQAGGSRDSSAHWSQIAPQINPNTPTGQPTDRPAAVNPMAPLPGQRRPAPTVPQSGFPQSGPMRPSGPPVR